MIELAGVSASYGHGLEHRSELVWAVRDVTLTVAAGELVAVVGESGSGKTTLMKLVNRLIDCDRGEVRVDGRDVRAQDAVALRRTIGYVIQQAGLLPHLTVGSNVAMVPRLLGWPAAEIATRVAELLDLVGLDHAIYRDRYPENLSGGQRQRVGVARALAARPKLLLLDEPFGALDPITRVTLQAELRRIQRELGLTTIMVTHDLLEALTLADRIAVMHGGELRQIGTPHELISAPADPYVSELIAMARRHAEQLRAVVDAPAGKHTP